MGSFPPQAPHRQQYHVLTFFFLRTPRPETPPQRARYPGHGTHGFNVSNILLTSRTSGCIYTRESPRVSESHTTTDCEQGPTRTKKKKKTHTHCANGNLSGSLSRPSPLPPSPTPTSAH
ncbi:unnamed protein product [Ectocarpus sp. 6 AP-2014]